MEGGNSVEGLKDDIKKCVKRLEAQGSFASFAKLKEFDGKNESRAVTWNPEQIQELREEVLKATEGIEAALKLVLEVEIYRRNKTL